MILRYHKLDCSARKNLSANSCCIGLVLLTYVANAVAVPKFCMGQGSPLPDWECSGVNSTLDTIYKAVRGSAAQ
jgi:hypothetical protein